MNIAEVIAEVRKRIAGLVACEIKHMGAQGGYFLCKWKGSLRCVHTMRSGSQGVRPATRTQHQAA